MSSMHPHWQSTGAPQAHATTSPQQPEVKITGQSASRRPAAVVGISLVVAILFAFVEGVDYLQGQLLTEVTITIDSEGKIDEPNVAVDPGTEIVWTNNSLSLFFIASDTLCDENGECMQIPLMPSSVERYRVPPTAPGGPHAFYREVPENVLGEITVSGNAPIPPPALPPPTLPAEEQVPAPPLEEDIEVPAEEPLQPEPEPVEEIEDPAPDLTEDPLPVQEEDPLAETIPPRVVAPTASSSSLPSAPVAAVELPHDQAPSPSMPAELPRNPYTVGSNLGATATPPVGGPAPEALHAGAPPLPPIRNHKPITQPETGMGTWVVLLLGIAGGLALMRSPRGTLFVQQGR